MTDGAAIVIFLMVLWFMEPATQLLIKAVVALARLLIAVLRFLVTASQDRTRDGRTGGAR